MTLDELLAAEKIDRTEGPQGVRNLAKLARILGYQDFSKWGQFEGGCYGDLLKLLEDNSFIIDAIHDAIRSSNSFNLNDDEDEDEDGILPALKSNCTL